MYDVLCYLRLFKELINIPRARYVTMYEEYLFPTLNHRRKAEVPTAKDWRLEFLPSASSKISSSSK